MKHLAVRRTRCVGLSLAQASLVTTTGLWTFFSLLQQTAGAVYSPLFSSHGLALLAFSIPMTFLGTAPPLLMVFWICLRVRERGRREGQQVSIYRSIKAELEGNTGIVLFFIVLLTPVYLVVEGFYALSIVPLTMPTCGLLGVCVGCFIFRRMNAKNRLTLMALLLLLTLATGYLDWNDRKPLLRDTYRIKVGMTASDVESLMASHRIGPAGPIDNEVESEPEGKNGLYYMTPRSSDMVVVNLIEGKVGSVIFSAD